MKKFKKFVIVAVAACMLILPFAPALESALVPVASAEGIGQTIETIIQYLGYDLSVEGIKQLLDDLQNGGLSGVLKLLGFDAGDIISEIQKYLNSFESETTTAPTTEEPTTEEPTTEAPTTQAPQPSYQYTPPATVPTTEAPETTTFTYIPPEQIYTEAPSTVPFTPDVGESPVIDNDVKPLSTAIGIMLLLAASIGVFIIIIALKKNRI